MTTEPKSGDKDQRDLFYVLKIATAICFGGMCSFLASLSDEEGSIALEFSFGTVVWAAVGAAIGWYFWVLIIRRAARKQAEQEAQQRGME